MRDVSANLSQPVSYTHLDVYKRQTNDSSTDIIGKRGCRSYMSHLMISGLLIAFLGCCLFGYMIAFSSEQAAYALVPPIYPQSRLQGKWVSGGTDSQWDRRTYASTASPEAIITYYHTHFPGATYRFEHNTYHIWYKCDHSWIATAVARWINEGKYPFLSLIHI